MNFTGTLIAGSAEYGEATCELTVSRGPHGSKLFGGTMQASFEGLDAAYNNNSVVVRNDQGREISVIITRWQPPSDTAEIKLSITPEWLR